MTDVPATPWAERYALAIGVARVMENPADAIARILKASDEHCRKTITAGTHNAVGHLLINQRKRPPDHSADRKAKFFDPHKWPYSGFRGQG